MSRNGLFIIESNFYLTKELILGIQGEGIDASTDYLVIFRHSKTPQPVPLSHYFYCGDTVLTVFMCILTCYQ